MMLRRNPYHLLLLPALAMACTTYAGAQATTTGNIQGIVVDPGGAAIPNASLTISSASTGAKITVTSNSVGEYTFSDLQVGNYQMTTTAPGFSTTLTKSVAVLTGRTIDIKVSLQVGGANTEISVSADNQVLETTTNTLAGTIKPDAVQDLPLNGRDASSLTQLTPGSQAAGDARYATFNNLPEGAVNATIDGMNSSFTEFKTSTSGNYSPAPVRLGALEEVSVSTSGLSADSGAEGAVTLRYQIKRGTNKYHGSAFWQYSSSFFNANSYSRDALGPVAGAKLKTHTNDEGGNIGGPILKDKVFFFGNYEQNFANGKTGVTGFALTPGAQQGNVTYTDTVTGAQDSVNVLSIAAKNGFPSTINARIASELAAANTALQGAAQSASVLPVYQTREDWSFNTITKNVYPTGRVDWQITPKMDVHVAYDAWWRSLPGTQVYPGDFAHTEYKSTYSTLTAGFDWTINQHIVNQVSAGLLNDQERFNATASFNPYTSINNIIYTSPSFTNGGGGANSASVLPPNIYTGSLPEPRNYPIRNISDNVTWTKGRHTMTFGGNIKQSRGHDLSISNPPAATLGISATDPALALFNNTNFPNLALSGSSTPDLDNLKILYATLTGRLSGIAGNNVLDTASGNYKVLGDAVLLKAQNQGGVYGQDNWRPTTHLTFNYGLHWEFVGATHNPNNVYTSPTLADLVGPSTGEFQPNQLGGITNPQIYQRSSGYSADLKEPGPNFGVVWNPASDGGKDVIRASSSINFYDEGWGNWEAGMSSNPGLRQSAVIQPGFGTGNYAPGTLFLGQTPALVTSPGSFAPPFAQSNYTFANNFSTIDPNIRSPYVENWSVGIQHKLPFETVFELNYIGNHAVHMWQTYNINEVNVFENGFLDEFKLAQADLASNGGTDTTKNKIGFQPNGNKALPILTQAFGSPTGSGFTSSTLINYVATGQAGALANAIQTNSTYFCQLVGSKFTPCANRNLGGASNIPINFFVQNPYSVGTSTATARIAGNPGSSQYNGLQAQIKHPVGHGLTLQMNYAYSHSFTTRYTSQSDSGTVDFITLRNKRLNRVPAPNDLRHAFKAYAVYALPFAGHSYLTKQLESGWTVSTVFTMQSGRNFQLTGGTQTVNGTADSGIVLTGTTQRLLQKSVGKYPGPNVSTPIVLMNPAVFAKPASGALPQVSAAATPGQFGQIVFLTAPRFLNTDFSVNKTLPVTEIVKLKFQIEMLNIFNHPNFTYGSGGPGNAAVVTAVPAVAGSTSAGISGAQRSFQFRTEIVF